MKLDLILPNEREISFNVRGTIHLCDFNIGIDTSTINLSKENCLLLVHYCPELAPYDIIKIKKYDYFIVAFVSDWWWNSETGRLVEFDLEIPGTIYAQERLLKLKSEFSKLRI